MEVKVQIEYKGYSAGYTVFEIASNYFHALLDHYSGTTGNYPPEEVLFILDNNHTIASSDEISIAKNLVSEIRSKHEDDFRFQHGG
jgi:hypothetical protein